MVHVNRAGLGLTGAQSEWAGSARGNPLMTPSAKTFLVMILKTGDWKEWTQLHLPSNSRCPSSRSSPAVGVSFRGCAREFSCSGG